ncbi:hypothetical protein ACIHCQ_29255 [Streptomyces sp. NPDC052236]|uniref:hypothetical protein n=1 Tax=Streptomyces sp. NPDC052236 TaxID=3365686 RepID=UPI0037D64E71
MDRIDFLIALVAALALAVVAWSKPLQNLPFWLFVLLCVVFYPAGRKLFSALESAAGAAGPLAEWTFMFGVNVLFAALVSSAYRGIKSFRGTRADRHSYHQEVDA